VERQAAERAALELTLDKAKALKLTTGGSVTKILASLDNDPKAAKEIDKVWAEKVTNAGK
jgi:hypothetical protein